MVERRRGGGTTNPGKRTTAAGISRERVDETAEMLRCLGHPVRLRMLDLLEREGEATVTEIFEALDLDQASASRHLGLMKDRGVLNRRKEGVHVHYSLGDPRAYKVLACIRGDRGAEDPARAEGRGSGRGQAEGGTDA